MILQCNALTSKQVQPRDTALCFDQVEWCFPWLRFVVQRSVDGLFNFFEFLCHFFFCLFIVFFGLVDGVICWRTMHWTDERYSSVEKKLRNDVHFYRRYTSSMHEIETLTERWQTAVSCECVCCAVCVCVCWICMCGEYAIGGKWYQCCIIYWMWSSVKLVVNGERWLRTNLKWNSKENVS